MKKGLIILSLIFGLSGIVPAAALHEAVLKPVQTFMDGMVKHDFALMSSAWHPNGKLFIMETMQPLEFLRNIPPVVKIEIDKIDVLSVDGMIAVVKVEWKMLMPKTIGSHRSYMNLIKIEGAWKIISETDYGDEKER